MESRALLDQQIVVHFSNECSSSDELIISLELVRTCMNKGELDTQIELSSEGVRSRFKK